MSLESHWCPRCQRYVTKFEDHDPAISHLGNEAYAWQIMRSVNTGTETKVILESNELPTLRHRPGDQPLPKPSTGPSMHELVQADLQKRLELGISRYGQPLQAHNGRNALQDAYEEALDLCVYLKQALVEQENQ